MSDVKITYHPCQGWGCHEHCIVECHSKDGKLVRVQKAHLPGPGGKPAERNEICMKGILNSKIPFADNRVLYPLKRTGERGSGQFERISWDQALDEIAEKINESIERYGTRSIVTNGYWCGYPGADGSLQNSLILRFTHALDASLMEYSAVDFATVWAPPIDLGFMGSFHHNAIRYAKNMVLIWGTNPLGFTRPSTTSRELMDAQERGAKLVHISNLFDVTSAKADEWIPVKSGSDAALALGVAHVLVRDGLVATNFLLEESSAPYLVRTDTEAYLRAGDIALGDDSNAFVVSDGEGNLKAIPRQTDRPDQSVNMVDYIYGNFQPALEADISVSGIACKSAYTLLVEHLAKWTPEYQQAISGVPAETCEALAHEIHDNAPVTYFVYDGLRYANSTQAIRAIMLTAYLSGNLTSEEAPLMWLCGNVDHPLSPMNNAGIMFPPNWDPSRGHRLSIVEILNSIENPDMQQYKVWLGCMGNPLLNWPNRDMWENHIIPNLDLFVQWEIRFTDTCRWADYVLPECTTFERHEVLSGQADTLVWCEPAMEPLGESKDPSWIWNELNKRIGLSEVFGTKTQEEWVTELATAGNQCMVTDDEAGNSIPITVDMLKEAQTLHLNLPQSDFEPFYRPIYGTPTGRLEFYSEILTPVHAQMADYEEPLIVRNELKEKYPLQLYVSRHKYFMQGQFTNVKECLDLTERQFGASINPKEAVRRGLQEGDTVEVFNQRGVMKVPLHLRNEIPEGMVQTYYSFDETYYPDSDCPQVLEEPLNHPDGYTEMLRFWAPWYVQHVMREQMGVPDSLILADGMEGTTETIWDVLCDIRKVEE